MRAIILSLVVLSLGCTTVSIKAQGAVELTRPGQPPERADVVAYKNESLSGVSALCFLTAIFYGGGCWAYLAYPTGDERAAFEKEVTESINTAGTCAKVTFIRAERNSWSAEVERVEFIDNKKHRFQMNQLGELCGTGPKFRAVPKTELPLVREKYAINAVVNCDDCVLFPHAG